MNLHELRWELPRNDKCYKRLANCLETFFVQLPRGHLYPLLHLGVQAAVLSALALGQYWQDWSTNEESYYWTLERHIT